MTIDTPLTGGCLCGAVRYEGEMIDEANRKMAESVARRGRWLGLTPGAAPTSA